MFDYPKVRLYISALISGAAVMILEIMGTRLIEPFLSNSVYTWIGMISVMLTSLSIGYFLGGKLADRNPQNSYMALLLILSGISIALIPVFSYQVLSVSSFFGIMYGPIIASLILFSIPSILLAMVSPYLIKLSARNIKTLGQISGNIYAISTVGSILGTLLAGFYIIPNLGIKATLFSMSIALIANGALFLGKMGVLPIILGLIINSAVPQPTSFIPSSSEILLYENYSLYQYLRVVDSSEKHTRELSMGPGYYSAMRLNSTDILVDYTRFQELVYALNPSIKKALFLGLGGGVMPLDMHRKTGADIDAVELDPSVIWLAKKFFNFSEDSTMRTYAEDGRLFLKNSNKTYDYIGVDAFVGFVIPPHLATVEFVEELKRHLNPEGIVFVNVISPLEGDNADLFRSMFKTYKNQFKNVYVFSSSNSNYSGVMNVILLATDSEYGGKEEFMSLINRSTTDNAIRELATHYYSGTIDLSSATLLTDDFSPVEALRLKAGD